MLCWRTLFWAPPALWGHLGQPEGLGPQSCAFSSHRDVVACFEMKALERPHDPETQKQTRLPKSETPTVTCLTSKTLKPCLGAYTSNPYSPKALILGSPPTPAYMDPQPLEWGLIVPRHPNALYPGLASHGFAAPPTTSAG